MKLSNWFEITVAVTLLVGGLTLLNAHAAERSLAQPAGQGRLLARAKEKLGLTDEQVAQIKTELGAEKETLKGLLARLHEARIGLREAIHSAGATDASVREAAAKVGAVQSDLAVERLKLYRRISPILTDDQREKVKEFETHIDEFVDRAIDRIGTRLNSNGQN
jgi:Spy/CpxP family protein refolding chaperone